MPYVYKEAISPTLIVPSTLPPAHPGSSSRSSKRRVGKMEASLAEHQLNARRKAVVLTGLPLLGLSFQTLGRFSSIPTPYDLAILRSLQGLSIPISALSALASLRGFKFR